MGQKNLQTVLSEALSSVTRVKSDEYLLAAHSAAWQNNKEQLTTAEIQSIGEFGNEPQTTSLAI